MLVPLYLLHLCFKSHFIARKHSNLCFKTINIWPSTVPLSWATSYPRDTQLSSSLIDNFHRMRGPRAEEATMIMEIFSTAYAVHVSPLQRSRFQHLLWEFPACLLRMKIQRRTWQAIVCREPHNWSDREYPHFESPPFVDRVEILRELISAGATEIGRLGTCWVILVENPDQGTKFKLRGIMIATFAKDLFGVEASC